MVDAKDPSLAIQACIDETLRDDASVKAEFGGATRLYTLVAPNDAKFPYAIIGGDQVLGEDTECASGSEIIVTIHIFARQGTPADSRTKAKAISSAIRTALSRLLPMEGHDMYDWSFDSVLHLVEADGLTAHSVLTFTYHTTALD